MKEINNIIKAYEKNKSKNIKVALATVVHVEGSSYRRSGARMLVDENGFITGAISGGCLEGDALKKALMAMYENKNKLVTYDTSNENNISIGVQLGCNGIVHILFEPIEYSFEANPVELLKKIVSQRKNAVIVTLFSLSNRNHQTGTVLYLNNEENCISNKQNISTILDQILKDAAAALDIQQSAIKNYTVENERTDAFIEVIKPAISLIICGAGNDVQPLAEMSDLLGWETILIDGRKSHVTNQRFPTVSRLKVASADEALDDIYIDAQTAFVLMTHNYNYDIKILSQLIETKCKYIGILGPQKKIQRMYDDLSNEGFSISNETKERIFSPVGIDLGAETSEEIALSITAEIKSFFSQKDAAPLRFKKENIHG